MPLQDLTPQLRTRLGRMERAVGIFVFLAAALLVSGVFYYLYHTAVRKGWFLKKVPYYVYVRNAGGLKAGDPVKMMGFDVGEIVQVKPMPPTEWFVVNQYNVFVQFLVRKPDYGYIWTDSSVKISADFLGKRFLEVMKGQTGAVTVVEKDGVITGILSKDMADTYDPLTKESKGVWLQTVDESPTASEKLDEIVRSVEGALPPLTNQMATLLANGTRAASNLDALTVSARPVATNLADITLQLREFNGSLGRWLFTARLNDQFQRVASQADATLTDADTNLVVLAAKLSQSLDNMALLTSNLNAQVQANTNMLAGISDAVRHSDEFVQGLKRHWMFRSAFKPKSPPATNQPLARPLRLPPGHPRT